jgi:hypothetical protein
LAGSVDDFDGNGFPILKFDVGFTMSFKSRSITLKEDMTNKEAGFWDWAIAKDDDTFDRDGEKDWCGKVQQSGRYELERGGSVWLFEGNGKVFDGDDCDRDRDPGGKPRCYLFERCEF